MTNCTVLDWQGKEAGESSIDLKTAKESSAASEIVALLKRVGIDSDGKILIILNKPSEIIKRSIKNLEKVKLISADQLNVFDLLNANSLVIGEDALSTIKEVYGND